jgi:hypothetical protein
VIFLFTETESHLGDDVPLVVLDDVLVPVNAGLGAKTLANCFPNTVLHRQ